MFAAVRDALLQLREWLAEQRRVKPEHILHPVAVDALARAMPETPDQLKEVWRGAERGGGG
jgi:hypothetical protein